MPTDPLGRNASGSHEIQIYWQMGRSASSRNRILVLEGDNVRTIPFDDATIVDPSLVIYTPIRSVGSAHIVTNGEQTDTIVNYLELGSTFEAALLTWAHEPDPPNFTPRISGMTVLSNLGTQVYLSKISSSIGRDDCSDYAFYRPALPPKGFGLCLHTYEGDGNPLPSFAGDPYLLPIGESIDEIADIYWKVLNAENRVALAVKTIDRQSGSKSISLRNAR